MSESHDGSRWVTDEKFNTCSHLVGLVLAVFGLVHLVVRSSVAGSVWQIVAFSIYGFTLSFLFLCSTLHHGVRCGERGSLVLRSMDYIAIYLLIAGTITPVTLVLIRSPYGWTVFGVSWLIAVAGILLKIFRPNHAKGISSTLFLVAGWITLFTAGPVWHAAGWEGVFWLGLGGVLYSLGAVIFSIEKPNPIPGRFGFHEIWHLFVLAAAAAHYMLMVRVVLRA